jgi:hypothetical protein
MEDDGGFTGTELKIYINGQLENSAMWYWPVQSNSYPTFVGTGVYGNDRWFNGNMSDIRVWDVVRSQVEIQNNLYTSSFSSPNLIGHWGLDEGSGTTSFDKTSNNNDADIYGASWSNETPSISSSGQTTYIVTGTDANGCMATDSVDVTINALPIVDAGADVAVCYGDSITLNGSGADSYVWDNGVTDATSFIPTTNTSGNSLSFDGVDDYVETNFVGGDIRNKFSFSVTFKTNDPNGGPMFGKYGNLCGLGYAMVIFELHDSIPRLLMRQNNGASSVGVALPSIPLSDNQWHTVNFTYDNTGTSPICYSVIDGNPGTYISQDVWGNSPIQTLTGNLNQLPWFIGTFSPCHPNPEYFNGSISNLALYDDIVYDFNVAQNPMLSYSFSSGSGNALMDGSQNQNNGTINGATWSNETPSTSSSGQTTYIVTGTDANGCMATDSVDVTINALPTIDAGTDLAVCDGDTLTLSASGAVTYAWDNAVNDATPFMPTATATYTVTGTDANGCVATDSVDVTVNSISITSSSSDVICNGSADGTATAIHPSNVIPSALINFTNWGVNEPNNAGGEDYAHFTNNSGEWNDHTSTYILPHVMEAESDLGTLSNYFYLGTYQGHYYYNSTTSATWSVSKTAAENAGGYLVVFSGLAENNFVANLSGAAWIGLYQDTSDPSYSEPSGGWKWIEINGQGGGVYLFLE